LHFHFDSQYFFGILCSPNLHHRIVALRDKGLIYPSGASREIIDQEPDPGAVATEVTYWWCPLSGVELAFNGVPLELSF